MKKYENVEYLNFLEDDRFKLVDFHNADHLNANGATKLTLLLNDIIENQSN